MKALLPSEGNLFYNGIEYLKSLNKARDEYSAFGIISSANRICQSNRVNAVFCNRASILVFKKRKPGTFFPLNHISLHEPGREINSS
jgi:hypothetical protein